MKDKDKDKNTEASKDTFPKDSETVKQFGEGLGRGIAFGIVFALNFFAFVVFNFLYRFLPFTTDQFKYWLPFVDAQILISIVVQLSLIFIDNKIIRILLEVVRDSVSLMSSVAMLIIFPFDFADEYWLSKISRWMIVKQIDPSFIQNNMGMIFRFILTLAIFGTTVGIIVNVVKVIKKIIEK